MENAATTTPAGLAVLDGAYSGSRGAGGLTQSAAALIDAAAEDTSQRKELLTNDVPPGAGG